MMGSKLLQGGQSKRVYPRGATGGGANGLSGLGLKEIGKKVAKQQNSWVSYSFSLLFSELDADTSNDDTGNLSLLLPLPLRPQLLKRCITDHRISLIYPVHSSHLPSCLLRSPISVTRLCPLLLLQLLPLLDSLVCVEVETNLKLLLYPITQSLRIGTDPSPLSFQRRLLLPLRPRLIAHLLRPSNLQFQYPLLPLSVLELRLSLLRLPSIAMSLHLRLLSQINK